jgi:PAS domain S-box-containing protein
LQSLSLLREQCEEDLGVYFRRAVGLVSEAWQFPAAACARILYRGESYPSKGFSETNWVQTANLTFGKSLVGLIEVRYTRELPMCDDGPFLDDEQVFLETVAREISYHAERVSSFEAIRVSEQRLSDIVNFLPDPTFAIDMSGRIIAWNRAMEQCSGLTAAQVLGRGEHLYALPYYGERRPIMIDLILNFDPELASQYPTMKVDGDTLTAELFVPRSGTQGRHLSAKVSPLYGNRGEVVGAIETTRDITDIKMAQKALVETTRQLEQELLTLEEKDAALREVIRQIDVEKKQLAQQVQGNIDRVVKPMLRSLQSKVDSDCEKSMTLIADYLDNITAPFVDKLERAYKSLSPREMQICSMIRDGMSCKEIANTLAISVNTVLNQRQRIRKKLKISRRKVNLRSFLRSL